MNIIEADLVKKNDGIRIVVQAYAPTLGWTNVSLSSVEYLTPPIDGIQDTFLNGTPPNGDGLTSIVMYPLSTMISESE